MVCTAEAGGHRLAQAEVDRSRRTGRAHECGSQRASRTKPAQRLGLATRFPNLSGNNR
jgi:hypothetical protein